jgi:hypothetical protein
MDKLRAQTLSKSEGKQKNNFSPPKEQTLQSSPSIIKIGPTSSAYHVKQS